MLLLLKLCNVKHLTFCLYCDCLKEEKSIITTKQFKILHLSFRNISTHFTTTFHVCSSVTMSSVKWDRLGRYSADVKQNTDIPFLMPFLFHHRTFVLYVIKAVLRRKITCPRYPMLPPNSSLGESCYFTDALNLCLQETCGIIITAFNWH